MDSTLDLGAGVYRIRDLSTNESYIGQSADMSSRRYSHLQALKSGRHINPRLQQLWTTSGGRLVFEVIAHIDDPDERITRESSEKIALGPLCVNGYEGPEKRPGAAQRRRPSAAGRKRPTSFRLSPESLGLLDQVARYDGSSAGGALERLIRDEASARGIH